MMHGCLTRNLTLPTFLHSSLFSQNSFLKAQSVQEGLTVPERNGGSVDRLWVSSARTKVPLHIPTAQDPQEGSPKSPVQKSIQEWIQARVDVTQPEPSGPHLPGHAVINEGIHHVGNEEGRPAQTEAAHNDSQRLGRLGFILNAIGARLIVVWVSWRRGRAGPM